MPPPLPCPPNLFPVNRMNDPAVTNQQKPDSETPEEPCPHCAAIGAALYMTSNGSEAFFVECGKCGGSGPTGTTLQDALKKWDRRPFTAREDELAKALEASERLRFNRYLPWVDAGGPNECKHGRAESIACPMCDANLLEAHTQAKEAR